MSSVIPASVIPNDACAPVIALPSALCLRTGWSLISDIWIRANRTPAEYPSIQNSSRPCENSPQRIPARRVLRQNHDMPYIAGHDRSQLLLLPESLDHYIGPENPVRFIDTFVDGLDLAASGFVRVEPKETGRPGYMPADLLKLYIYDYLNRIRSSCRLEAETHRNIEMIWLLRHLKPDFKTIVDFRRDNRKAFRPVFRQFVLLCKQVDCSAASYWLWTARASRRSTTRTAISPVRHWPRSSNWPTRSSTIASSVLDQSGATSRPRWRMGREPRGEDHRRPRAAST